MNMWASYYIAVQKMEYIMRDYVGTECSINSDSYLFCYPFLINNFDVLTARIGSHRKEMSHIS